MDNDATCTQCGGRLRNSSPGFPKGPNAQNNWSWFANSTGVNISGGNFTNVGGDYVDGIERTRAGRQYNFSVVLHESDHDLFVTAHLSSSQPAMRLPRMIVTSLPLSECHPKLESRSQNSCINLEYP